MKKGYTIPRKELFDAFISYCKDASFSFRGITNSNFYATIQKMGFNQSKCHGGILTFHDIKLKDDDDDDDDDDQYNQGVVNIQQMFVQSEPQEVILEEPKEIIIEEPKETVIEEPREKEKPIVKIPKINDIKQMYDEICEIEHQMNLASEKIEEMHNNILDSEPALNILDLFIDGMTNPKLYF
jgi:hypothetical protein